MPCDAGSVLLCSVSNTLLASKLHGTPDTTVPAPARAGRAGQELRSESPSRMTTTATRSAHSSPARTVLRAYTHHPHCPPCHLLPCLQKRNSSALEPRWPGPVCPQLPFLAAKFKSESGGWISGGDRLRWLKAATFGGGVAVWRPRQERLPKGGAGLKRGEALGDSG